MIFISYCHEDRDMVKRFEILLKARGVKVWRDENNLAHGDSFERSILEGLEHSKGMVTFWTPNSLCSKGVAREMDFGENISRKKDTFFQFPIFIECSFEDVKDKRGVHLKKGSRFTAEEGTIEEFLKKVANQVVHTLLEHVSIPSPICVGIYSKHCAPKDVDEDFTLDFYDLLSGENEKNLSSWRDIEEALYDFFQILSGHSKSKSLKIHSFCNLSLSILFGSVFNRVSGYQLVVETEDGDWDLALSPESGVDLQCSSQEGDFYNDDTALIGIHLDQPMEIDMPIRDQNYRVCKICFPIYKETKDPIIRLKNQEAVQIALKLREECIAVRKSYKIKTIHLFAAVPKGLAYMIGYNSNAIGPIQVYGFDNQRREYYPTIIIS